MNLRLSLVSQWQKGQRSLNFTDLIIAHQNFSKVDESISSVGTLFSPKFKCLEF